MTNEIELNARFDLLISQRNNALNQNVLDAGIIAALQSRIKILENIKTLEDIEDNQETIL
jgi:hypothetical protein